MFEVYRWSETEFISFFLVLIRISVCFATWPIIGTLIVPQPVKILISLVVSLLMFPHVSSELSVGETQKLSLVWLVVREVSIGLVLGLVSRFFFFIMTICGEIVSVSIGVSADQLFNPAFGSRTSAVEQLLSLIGTLLFFAVNGHHSLIEGLAQSFTVLPLSSVGLNLSNFDQVVAAGQMLLVTGVKMAAPVMAVIFFMNVALGVLNRASPQINVLVTSLAVNVFAGLTVLILAYPSTLQFMSEAMTSSVNSMFELMKVI
jgi:flagellar biosynthetic protein FliR